MIRPLSPLVQCFISSTAVRSSFVVFRKSRDSHVTDLVLGIDEVVPVVSVHARPPPALTDG